MPCHGNAEDHCCYYNGSACAFVEENTVPGRRWACGLLRKLGTWGAVLASRQYRENVAPHLEPHNYNCRDWPDKPGVYCDTCGWKPAQ